MQEVLQTHFLQFPSYQLKDYSHYDQYIQYYKQQNYHHCKDGIPLLITISHQYLTCTDSSLSYKMKFLLELIELHLSQFPNDFLQFLHEKLVFFCKNQTTTEGNTNGLEHILQIQSFLLLSHCMEETNSSLYLQLIFKHGIIASQNGYVKQACCNLFFKILPFLCKEELQTQIQHLCSSHLEEWIEFLYLFCHFLKEKQSLNHFDVSSVLLLQSIPWNQLASKYHSISSKCIFVANYFALHPSQLFTKIETIKTLSYAIQLSPNEYVSQAKEWFCWDAFYLEQIVEPLIMHRNEEWIHFFLEKICNEAKQWIPLHCKSILLFLTQHCNTQCFELIKQHYKQIIHHSSKNLEMVLQIAMRYKEKEWIIQICKENLIEEYWNWEMRDTVITFLKQNHTLLVELELRNKVKQMIILEIEPYVKLNCLDLIPLLSEAEEEIFSKEEFWNQLQTEDLFLKTKVLQLISKYNSHCIELIEAIYNQMEWEIYPHCCRVLSKWGLQHETLYQNLQREYDQQKALQELHHESQEWIQVFSPKQGEEEEQDCHYA